MTQRQGMLVPAGTPQGFVERPHREISRVLKQPEAATFLANDGATVVGGTPGQFKAALEAGRGKRARIIKQAAIRPE